MDIESTDNLETLFRKLEEIHKVDPEKSSLIFSGQVLYDLSQTLEDLKYKENDWFVLFNRKLRPGTVSTPTADVSKPSTRTESHETPATSATSETPTNSRLSNNKGNMTRPNRLPPNTQTVKISEEAVQSLLEILLNDPNCSRLLQENPGLMLRIRDPTVLVNLANMVGLDLSRFVRRNEPSDPEESEPKISDTIWPSRNYNVPLMPAPSRPEAPSAAQRQVLRISAAEARVLTKIKTDLMDILGELPENINEYQINTIIYECYVAADKNPEAALNILIDHMLDQGDRSDLGLSSPIRPNIQESITRLHGDSDKGDNEDDNENEDENDNENDNEDDYENDDEDDDDHESDSNEGPGDEGNDVDEETDTKKSN